MIELQAQAEEVRVDESIQMLAFRDHLRRDDADRALYVKTKRELAARTWTVTQDYADAKSDVVSQILQRAQAAGPQPLRGCFIQFKTLLVIPKI